MGNNKLYENAQQVVLSDYLPASMFRIIPGEYRDIPGGISEVRVTFDIKAKFSKKLSFKVSGSGRVYGWIRRRKSDDKLPPALDRIEFVDWSNKFLMLFVGSDKSETAYFVTAEEVKTLLEDCLRPVLNN